MIFKANDNNFEFLRPPKKIFKDRLKGNQSRDLILARSWDKKIEQKLLKKKIDHKKPDKAE